MHRKSSDDLAIKSVSDEGRFSGYLSRWNVVDHHRERVAPFAFQESLAALEAKGRKLPVLWQHRADEPVGDWDVLREDDIGLYGEGNLWLDVAPNARLAHRGMKSGAITGLSIGFRVKAQSFDDGGRIRTLKSIELHEGSIVTAPALDEARIDTIKQKLAAGEEITEREFGKILREKGFSRSDADAIASVGFKAWAAGAARPQQADRAGMDALAAQLRGFSLPKF
jgi:hypothetical protein